MSDKEELLAQIQKLTKELKVERNRLKKANYGLVWLDVPEAFEDNAENKLPILEEVKDKAITNDDGKPTHILIEGDNYHALTCLNYTHKGKIDLIYIDPPYNTGSDGFIYKDKRMLDKFPDGTEVPKDHPLRHSYWLSFMSKRLELAKDLLKRNGVIFISIGEDEHSQLKLLCNKIFGENNFINSIPRVAKKTSDKGTYFKPTKDYIIVCAKETPMLSGFGIPKTDDIKKYKFEDERGIYKKNGASIYQPSLDSRPNQRYWIECPDGSFIIPPGNNYPSVVKDASFIKPTDNDDKCWRWSWKRYLKDKDKLIFTKASSKSPLINENMQIAKWNLYDKVYWDDIQGDTNLPEDIIYDFKNSQGTKHLLNMGLKFSFSKPFQLIKYLIDLTQKKDDIITLDFFAGSGTTLEAVLQLNNTDKGVRQAIIVTNNENDIAVNVTYPRIVKCISGYMGIKSKEYVEGFGGSVRYYKTAFVGSNNILSINDKDKTELAQKAGCLLSIAENTLDEVEHTSHFQFFKSNDRNTAIYFQEDLSELDTFVHKVEKLENPTTVYLFSWSNKSEFESMLDHIPNINIKTIPQPILEIYKKIYNINN